MKNQYLKDANAKAILKIKPLMAPIIKGTLEEFNYVSIEDIINIYLSDPLDPDNPEVKLLNSENGGFEKINTVMDLYYKLKTPYDYDLIVNVELFTTKNSSNIQIRLRTYQANLLVSQSYKLEELDKDQKKDFYNYLDHPVQIVITTQPAKSLKNTITRIENHPKKVIYSDGLRGPVTRLREIDLLPSEKKAYSLDRQITINLDMNGQAEVGSLFEYLKDGLFSIESSKEERMKTIEKFTGKLRRENKMAVENYLGSNEYYKDAGIKIGKQEENQKNRNNVLNFLISEGYSKEEALKYVNNLMPEIILNE